MKKVLFAGAIISIAMSFTGCKLITSILGGVKKESSHISEVISTDSFEVTSFGDIKLSDYNISISSDSQVFVVQVNEGDSIQDSGILKSEVAFDDYEESIPLSRSISNSENESFINVLPNVVKNPIKAPKHKVSSSMKHPNFSLTGSSVGDIDDFKVPLDSSGDAYDDLFCCDLVYESKHSYVYYSNIIGEFINDDSLTEEEKIEKGSSYLGESDFKKIGDTFDKIFDLEVELLGRNDDFEYFDSYIKPIKNSKIVILVYDIYCDSNKKNKSWTYGFFNPNDFLLEGYNSNSNEDQIIYIDTVLYKKSPETTLSTLAHEFAHLLNYCNKNMKTEEINDSQLWFSEMIAMNTEDLLFEKVFKPLGFSTNTVVKNRIPDYLSGHQNGYANWDSKVLDSYGNSFAYGAFLIRNFGGPQLLHEIAVNPLFDEDSINFALKKMNINKDYYKTLSEYAKSSVNQKISENSNNVNSLLKSKSWKNFVANKIDVLDYNSSGITLNTNKSIDIGPGGFIVQYAGKGTKKINVTKPSGKDLKVYVVVQTVEQ